MAAKNVAFYAVKVGQRPGVYSTWDACQQQVNGYPGAVFKKFPSLELAQGFVGGGTNVPFFKDSGTTSTHSIASVKDKVTKPKPKPTAIHQQLPPGKKVETFYAVNFPKAPPKIFRTWDECQKATSGVQNVTFKKFPTLELARRFTKQKEKIKLTEDEKKILIHKYLTHNFKNNPSELKVQQTLPAKIIYTDGSLLNGKYGGIGIFFGEHDQRNQALPFPGCKSSYSAEVKAILIALRMITSEIKKFEDGTEKFLSKYVISSDNQAAVSVLRDYASTWTEDEIKTREEGEMVAEMIKLYNQVKAYYEEKSVIFGDHEFEIQWIKGHFGLEGNEQADALAGQGSEKCRSMDG